MCSLFDELLMMVVNKRNFPKKVPFALSVGQMELWSNCTAESSGIPRVFV